ncbi:MAG: class I SAM-dependent methyltransferase [Acidobacteria bacterium]|nr:class I SAM-dependent methyltransferase [Acidobacteriota bacterium]
MTASRATRGHGVLEPLLARLRARRAEKSIPRALRRGRILDIGCGSSPYFLAHTYFAEKYAVDQLPPAPGHEAILWHTLDLNRDPSLPFPDGHFSVVTMLAVAEHLDPSALEKLLVECRRALAEGGRLVLTTPAARADGLLRLLARLRLVSPEEIDEHKFAYTPGLLGWYFGRAGFEMTRIAIGHFELGMNLWATADR